MVPDDLAQAVLSREDVVRYLQSSHGGSDGRERVFAYLEELKTTQRYPFYRALKHPLYPILRKIDRRVEHLDIVEAATRAGRVIYASNHKSHTDYLVEPVVLDDNGVRPPIIAAGINLFGGPLGLIHRHVTGAIPIRRNAKDPAYLVTLKAYVAELLRRHDLLFYPEGGRSYSGELKSPKTGLLHAALNSETPGLMIVPTAISYDLVLEDHILAKQRVKRRQRPFARELAEMVRYAVGYRSRCFLTFGRPIPLDGWEAESRRDIMELGRLTTRVDRQAHQGATDVRRRDGHAAVGDPARSRVARRCDYRDASRRRRESRGLQRPPGGRRGRRASRVARHHRLRSRTVPRSRPQRPSVLRALDRTPSHVWFCPHPLMLDVASKSFFQALSYSRILKTLASRYGMSGTHAFARRFIAGETVEDAIAAVRHIQSQGLLCTLDYLGESVTSLAAAENATREYLQLDRRRRPGWRRAQPVAQADAAWPRRRSRDLRRQPAEDSDAAGPSAQGGFFVRIDMESSAYTDATLDIFETVWKLGHRNVGVVLQSCLYRTEKDFERVNALGARIRLVKGAYREPKSLAHQLKSDVDAAYVRLAKRLLTEGAYPAIATHDEEILDEVKRFAADRAIASDAYEFQLLYGIRRDLQAELRDAGYRVRVYVPFGREWFPYFMRRLGERPANVGFVVRSLFAER